jgi:hypothetical protein
MSRKVSSDHTTVSYPELDNPDIEFDASNLISTSPEDISDDDFRRELNFLHDGNGNGNGTSQSSSGGRPCSIAHFVEGKKCLPVGWLVGIKCWELTIRSNKHDAFQCKILIRRYLLVVL